jgi:hypothetical protein
MSLPKGIGKIPQTFDKPLQTSSNMAICQTKSFGSLGMGVIDLS